MSSFIVNDKTINRILTFMNRWDFAGNSKEKFSFWKLSGEYNSEEEREEELSRIGLILKDLNARAVFQRYAEKEQKQEFKYKIETCNIFQAYQHIRCLTYQMAEGDIPKTDLYKLCIIYTLFVLRY